MVFFHSMSRARLLSTRSARSAQTQVRKINATAKYERNTVRNFDFFHFSSSRKCLILFLSSAYYSPFIEIYTHVNYNFHVLICQTKFLNLYPNYFKKPKVIKKENRVKIKLFRKSIRIGGKNEKRRNISINYHNSIYSGFNR